MRIVNYVYGWPPDRHPNGIVTATARLASALRAAGHDARIVASLGSVRAGEDYVTVIEEPRAAGRLDRLAARIANRLSRGGALYHRTPRKIAATINRRPALAGAAIVEIEESFGWSRILAGRIAPPVVTRLHGPYFLTGAAQTGGVFSAADEERIRREGAAIAAAAFVTAPSRFVLDAVREKYGCALAGAAVIANPAPQVEAAKLWRRERADPDRILFVGRFDRIKGADILLEAFAALAADYPRLRLSFAGPADGALKFGDRKLAREALLGELMPPEAAARVEFHGLVGAEALSQLRAGAFLTVVASRIEMFPNVLLEAMAHAAPTVATRVGGIPEIARDGEDALLAAPDAGALAAAMRRLLDHPDEAARLGEQGHKRVMAEYSPDRVAARTIAAYEAFLGARPAAAPTGAR